MLLPLSYIISDVKHGFWLYLNSLSIHKLLEFYLKNTNPRASWKALLK